MEVSFTCATARAICSPVRRRLTWRNSVLATGNGSLASLW